MMTSPVPPITRRAAGTFAIPAPPEELSYEQALDDPLRLPLETRMKAAHALLDRGEIDGWNALAFAVYGRLLDD